MLKRSYYPPLDFIDLTSYAYKWIGPEKVDAKPSGTSRPKGYRKLTPKYPTADPGSEAVEE